MVVASLEEKIRIPKDRHAISKQPIFRKFGMLLFKNNPKATQKSEVVTFAGDLTWNDPIILKMARQPAPQCPVNGRGPNT